MTNNELKSIITTLLSYDDVRDAEYFIINIVNDNDTFEPIKKIFNRTAAQQNLRDIHHFAFVVACGVNDLHIVQWLIFLYPQIDVNCIRDFPFQIACGTGSLSTAQWLRQNYKIDICADSNVAFRWSCRFGQLHVAKWLSELLTNWDFSGLACDMVNPCSDEILDFLIPYIKSSDFSRFVYRIYQYNKSHLIKNFILFHDINSLSVGIDYQLQFDEAINAAYYDNYHTKSARQTN